MSFISLCFRSIVALYIPLNAYKKGSLNLGGAVLAGLLAVITLVLCPTLAFAVSLLSFFFLGSKATKYKADLKAKLEEPEDLAGPISNGVKATGKDLQAGNRSAAQVACNGLLGTAACAIWIYRFGSSLDALHAGPKSLQACPISAGRATDQRMSNTLVFTAVSFWAACMGDTLASELGMLARTKPRMITSLQEVAPGTNGGVTVWGTLVSFLGGQIISLAAAATLLLENGHCRSTVFGVSSNTFTVLVAVGGISGLLGSLLDSLLGATVQETLYSKNKKMVVHDHGHGKKSDGDVMSIGGYGLLSNNGVNAVASCSMGLLGGWIGWQLS